MRPRRRAYQDRQRRFDRPPSSVRGWGGHRSTTGHTGEGALIGAVSGALVGGAIGYASKSRSRT